MAESRNVLLPGAGAETGIAKYGRFVVAALATSAITLSLAIFGLHSFLSSDLVLGTNQYPSIGYTLAELVGFVAWMYLPPISVALIGVITLVILKHHVTARLRFLWLFFLCMSLAAALVSGALLSRDVLHCGIFFCQNAKAGEASDPTGLINSIGLWILVLAVGLAIAVFCTVSAAAAGGQARKDPPPLVRRLILQQRRRCMAGACLAIVVIPLCFLLTTVLPPQFKAMHLAKGGGDLRAYMAMRVSGAEYDGAWMQTMNIELSNSAVLKLFPDTLIYYGFLEVVAIVSVFAAALPGFRRLLARHCIRGTSLGEILLLSLFVCMLVLWLWYWLHDHSFENGRWKGGTERIARSLGMTAVLVMSLTLLPAAKTSLWLEALGVSWESSLWIHRWLGRLTVILMLGHVVAFWIDFAALDIFPHDILAIPTFYPMNGPKPKDPQGDDWTISMMQLIGYPSILALGLPPLRRRTNWELFKYFHYVFMALIPATLLHAPSAWYFMLGSIGFWLVDASLRFASAAKSTPLLAVAAHDAEGGVTELRLDKAFNEPGQYCFVNVPEVSLWEWHPFSLCSSPLDGSAQMCIKNMGQGSFTGRLHDLAKQKSESGSSFAVNMDGPYGPPLDPTPYSAILLVAGGIGITPMHSNFRLLAQLSNRSELPASLELVRLVWIARSEALFRILLESLSECLRPGQFEVVLYLNDPAGTNPSPPSICSTPGLTVLVGRPSFNSWFEEVGSQVRGERQILVKACGPEPMTLAAESAARGRERFVFESELFIL